MVSLRRNIDKVGSRDVDNYKKVLYEAAIDILAEEGRHLRSGTNIRQKITAIIERTGEFLNKAIQMIHKYPIECLLLNCNSLIRTINASEIISANWSKKWGVYPNVGIGEPSPNGIIKNYHTDEDFLIMIDKVIELGVNVIGGCCGSSPKHINLIKNQHKLARKGA